MMAALFWVLSGMIVTLGSWWIVVAAFKKLLPYKVQRKILAWIDEKF